MPILTTFKDEGSAPVKTQRTPEQKKSRAEDARRWRMRNPTAAKATKLRYMEKRGLAHNRARHLYERYGLTMEDYQGLLTAQHNRCAICQGPFGDSPAKRPVVDHNHGNGRVRGILHRECNAALGVFMDDADLLRRAAKYVAWEDTCL